MIENLDSRTKSSLIWNAVTISYSGIMWAGAAFGACLVLAPVLISFFRYPFPTAEFFGQLFGIFFGMAIAALAGFLFAVMSGGLSTSAVLILNRFFGGALTRRSAVAIAGGLAGFLPAGAIAILIVGNPLASSNLSTQLWLAGSPGVYVIGFFVGWTWLAMVFGHVGALWAANSGGVWRNLKRELDFKQSQQIPGKQGAVGVPGSRNESSQFQFGIRHLLVGTVACSCVLALDQCFSNHEVLITFGLYVVLQTILLWIDWLYFNSYCKKLIG